MTIQPTHMTTSLLDQVYGHLAKGPGFIKPCSDKEKGLNFRVVQDKYLGQPAAQWSSGQLVSL